jgi:hypothetical protein
MQLLGSKPSALQANTTRPPRTRKPLPCACRSHLQSAISTPAFASLMQERPKTAQAFLLQCMPATVPF